MEERGCQFKQDEWSDECGKTPTTFLEIGSMAPDPTTGTAVSGQFKHAYFCQEHVPIVQQMRKEA
jgi:hypothetical protein